MAMRRLPPDGFTTDRITVVVLVRFSVHTTDASCALIRAWNGSKGVCLHVRNSEIQTIQFYI
jgi:hypothetical protein